MSHDEVAFCESSIRTAVYYLGEPLNLCVDNYRAARVWVSSQVRRFWRLERTGCCGSYNSIVRMWSWRKFRYDYYLIGFNYGH